MHKAFHPRDGVEKVEEEDLPAHKMHRYNDSKIRLKNRKGKLITVTRNDTCNRRIKRTKITRKQEW